MGIKKIAIPINKAKNKFIQWLKDNKAEDIDEYEGEKSDGWDYYRHISAFVGVVQYSVYFKICNGQLEINYYDGENRYNKMSVEEFLTLIS